MHLTRYTLFCLLLLLPAIPSSAQTKSTREELAEAMKPLYEANLRTMQEYNCNMALINLDRQNALDMMAGKTPPLARYDSIITKATECIGTLGPNALAYDYRAKANAQKGDTKKALADYELAISTAKTEKSTIVRPLKFMNPVQSCTCASVSVPKLRPTCVKR